MKILSIGIGNALQLLTKNYIDNYILKKDTNNIRHDRILAEATVKFEDIHLKMMKEADIICVQGTWGSVARKYDYNRNDNDHYAILNEVNTKVSNFCKENKKPLIVFETNTLSRMKFNYIRNDLDLKELIPRYCRMGLGHWIYGKALWLNSSSGNKLMLFNKHNQKNYNFSIKSSKHIWQKPKNGNILILPGFESDPTNENVEQWITDSIEKIRTVSDRKILIKPHPRSKIDYRKFIQKGIFLQDNKTKIKHLKNIHAAVIDNSTSIFELIDLGIPCFCSKDSFGVDLGNVDLLNIENPKFVSNTAYNKWLIKMSHTEFDYEEIMQKDFFNRIIELANMYKG